MWRSSHTLSRAALRFRRLQRGTRDVSPVASFSTLSESDLSALKELETKINWLSTYMIHHANNLRPKRDGLKVGGHQASSASLVTVLTALYTKVLRPQDRVAVKPHASPAFHAIQYLFENQTLEQLQKFRSLGGIQSYPSRTKDQCEVDLSTGSVGLGATMATFLAHVEAFLRGKDLNPPAFPGTSEPPELSARTIGIVGDAELDEGSVFEGLLESWKLDIRNNWYIVDYNRQSLDKIMEENSFRLIDRLFRMNGFDVVSVKYGARQQDIFQNARGGKTLRRYLNECDNAKYSALTFSGGNAFRKDISTWSINSPIVGDERVDLNALLNSMNDAALHEVMTDLGGHCFETVLNAFEQASQSDRRTAFLMYTIKGYGLPLAGHRDNHGLFLQNKQVDSFQESLGIPKGKEWDKMAGVKDVENVKRLLKESPINVPSSRKYKVDKIDIPKDLAKNVGGGTDVVSTQAAFGAVMLELSKEDTEFTRRLLTCAPDVATTTQLSGYVNKKGIFSKGVTKDRFRSLSQTTLNNWKSNPKGAHVELGIAENNLMILIGAAGLSHEIFGQRLFPVGTLYDPFIARGLDSLTHGAYMKSKFMLVGTPSGITLGPEGGAHQSISSPLISMATPNLTCFEPAFADEVKACMREGFEMMQDEDGDSIYLRLTTRGIKQIDREWTPELERDVLRGGYFHIEPEDCDALVVFSGALAPEVLEAVDILKTKKNRNVSLLQVTSSDRLANEWKEKGTDSHISNIMSRVSRDATVVTVVDAHPTTLSWIGSVCGHRVRPLGVQTFGQSGDLVDLYREYEVDADAIVRMFD